MWHLIATAEHVTLAERDSDLGRTGELSVVLLAQKRVYVSKYKNVERYT